MAQPNYDTMNAKHAGQLLERMRGTRDAMLVASKLLTKDAKHLGHSNVEFAVEIINREWKNTEALCRSIDAQILHERLDR